MFAIPLPDTPKESTTNPDLPDDLLPVAITQTGAASGIQALPNGRLLFTRSSLTSPNDVFVIRELSEEYGPADFRSNYTRELHVEQLSKFTADALKGKALNSGEDFYFDGAEHKIHGWIVKPHGFKEGEKEKYPIILLIHGGPQGAWEDQWSTRWNPQGKYGPESGHPVADSTAVCSLRPAGLLHCRHQPDRIHQLRAGYAYSLAYILRLS